MSPKKILVIRLSSIGDILLTTPFIRQIHFKFPKANIDFVVKKEFEDLLIHNPYLNKVHTFDSSSESALKNLKNCIKKEKYDYIFDLHNNFRSLLLRIGLSVSYTGVIKKDKIRQLILLYFKINYYKMPKPVSQRYLDTGLKVGIKDDYKGLEIYWSEKETRSVETILYRLRFAKNEKFISIAPGAGFFTKRWPITYFSKLIKQIHTQLKVKIVILGGVGDKEMASELSHNPAVHDLSGQVSLLESAVILSQSAALVTNDTGLMHLATAVKKPVIAIFGSSVIEWGFVPYRSPHVLIEEKGLSCRPCSHIGRASCPKKHFKCMRNISPDKVFAALNSML